LARIAAAEFVEKGGDLSSKEAVPIELELLNAFNEVSTEFGHPILKDIKKMREDREIQRY